jgi:hypothetical protein
MSEPVALLWTGGWDSTYRLLDLCLSHRRPVQPIYVAGDPHRTSTGAETEAIGRILASLERLDPEAPKLVLPLDRAGPSTAIAPDPEITSAYRRLRQTSALGTQYEWLARFAAERGATGLELSIHRDDIAEPFLRGHVTRAPEPPPDDCFALASGDPDLTAVFGRYRFPLLDLTKVEMADRARELGFAELLELTWFCHHPRRGRPCGACNPCLYTRREGLGRRVPWAPHRRAERRARELVRRIRRATRADPSR